MPLWRLLVLLADVEREFGASAPTSRLVSRLISERLQGSAEDVSTENAQSIFDANGKLDPDDPRLNNTSFLFKVLVSARQSQNRQVEELVRSRLSRSGINVVFADELDSPMGQTGGNHA